MIIWRALSIDTRLIPRCRRFSPSWIRFTAPSASHHVTNWKSGRAIPRNRDADLRDGISRKANCAPVAAKKRSGTSSKFEGEHRCRRCLHPRSCITRGCKSRRGEVKKAPPVSAEGGGRTQPPHLRRAKHFVRGGPRYTALKI